MKARSNHILRTLLILLAIAFFVPAMAQNTKGDRPVSNKGKVRETRGKVIKKKGRVTTKDIAGRRLRTKNKSSANRANVGIPQPMTTQRQPRRRDDRAARLPSNKSEVISKLRRKSDPDRQWRGDISGYKPRKIRPASAEESGRNVYPQGKYASKHPSPKSRPFKGYEGRTASGKPIVKRSPKHSERAWKGDLKGQPFYPPPSKTGRYSNVYHLKTKNPKYVSKGPSGGDRSYNNREKVQNARLMGSDTRPKNWKRGPINSPTGSAPFVTRGKKNVYWGKMKVGGKARTRDLAGRPLSRKNFRSAGMGIVGRDTLAFFGRRPHGDLVGGQRRRNIPSSEARGGWLNDIAGYRLRKNRPRPEAAGDHRYSGFRSITGKLRTNGKVAGKAPGIGAGAIAKHLKKTNGGGGRDYGDQGGAFTGFIKRQKPEGSYIGTRHRLWNNNRSPINGKALPGSGLAAGRFSGRIRGGPNKKFGDQGSQYTGDIKRGKKYADQGSGYTGDIKRKTIYRDQAENYRGFLKSDKKAGKFVGSLHRLWNNNGSPINGKAIPGSGVAAGRFSGNIKGRPDKNYSDQGSQYTGDIKRKKLYTDNAENYRGFLKAEKPAGKYVGTVHRMWNNKGKTTTVLLGNRDAALAGRYQGHTKPNAKGKAILVPSKHWSNDDKATTRLETSRAEARAGSFQGHMKAKKPEKYPLNSNYVMWNNKGKATTQIKMTKSVANAGKFQGKTKYKRESKDRDANIEDRIRIKEQYVQSPHSVDEALKKQKPEVNYRAGRFASGAKVVGKRTHSPHSVDDALDVYHNQASARRTDYQGNIKMRKFADRRESPDAKFVKTGENNVKQDRTLFTNVKLLWAKLFQKSDSQPSNLKERSNKLRYDKGEKGLWAD